MKIVISATKFLPFRGGIENSIAALSHEFVAKGHDVTLLVSDLLPPNLTIPPADPVNSRIKIIRYHRPQVKGWMQITGLFLQMVNIWRATNQKYDLVICRDIQTALPLFIKNLRSYRVYIAPACVYKQNLTMLRKMLANNTVSLFAFWYNRYWYFPLLKLIQNCIVQLADSVVAWSKNTLVDLGCSLSSPSLKWKQINPGVDLKRFSCLRSDTCDSCLHLLMLCRLDAVKNIEDALRTISLCSFSVKLDIYGDGPNLEHLKNLADDLDISCHVNFAGQTDTPETVYPKADFFLMLSLYEPFGQTMIEAMACGVPVIAYESGESYSNAAAQVLTHGIDGYIIKPGPESLAQKLSELNRQTTNQRSVIRFNARKTVEKHYRWADTAQVLLQLENKSVDSL